MTPAQVAIAWARQQFGPHQPPIIPIVGASSLAQLTDNLGALDVTLDEAQLARLDEVSKIELGFPHDFLAGELVRGLVFAKTFDRIDSHRRG